MLNHLRLPVVVSAALLLAGTATGCGSDKPTTAQPASGAGDTASTGGQTDIGGSDEDAAPMAGKIDCRRAGALDGRAIATGATVSCGGWTVQLTNFQEKTSLPSNREFTTGDLQPVDASTPVASATIKISAAGKGDPDSYGDFAGYLEAADTPDKFDENQTGVLHEIEPGGSPDATRPVPCLVKRQVPCTGVVYYSLKDGVDMSRKHVYIALSAPDGNPDEEDPSMGFVQVE